MNFSNFTIGVEEYKPNAKSKSPKVKEIFDFILNRIEVPELKNEAEQKGFEIIPDADKGEDNVATYMVISVPNASAELKEYLELKLYNSISFMKI